jgi:hypothetical protein
MKGDKDKPRFKWKRIVVLLVVAVLAWVVWLMFFSYMDCDSWECFNENLEDCNRVKFIGGSKMIFEYIVRGEVDGACRVDVELLQGELNNQDSIKLERQSMSCMLPMGVIMIPESDITDCHGMLKEGFQDILIRKLHVYLVQNLGKLNLDMTPVPEL